VTRDEGYQQTMTTTQSAPDIAIVHGPTQDDARLILQLSQLAQNESHHRGSTILWQTEKPLTYDEFKAQYPRGSQGMSDVMNVVSWYETIGTLVKNGLLDRGLVHDWLWVGGIWDRCSAILLGQRAETVPQMWENFEALTTE
jgi:hypothetical protein